MAAIDYTVRGGGTLCSLAELQTAVGPGDTTLTIENFLDTGVVTIEIGQSALLGAEIVRIESAVSGTVVVARGCADTIPRAHAVGTLLWFFDQSVGTDEFEYAEGETIGVKALVKTTAREMAIDDAPPAEVQFVGRFARPYPPGRVQANGDPWYDGARADSITGGVTLTWAHRDRVLQADNLVDHESTSIGPEPGVTYTVVVYHPDDVSPRRIVEGITGDTFVYSLDMAIADFYLDVGGSEGDRSFAFDLYAIRDDYRSNDVYTIPFTTNVDDVDASGWSGEWDKAWGST